MRRNDWMLAIPIMYLLVLTGCTTFHGLKPIYPKVGSPDFPKGVDSLRPTFRWEPSSESDVTYDFIIYEGIYVPATWTEKAKRSVGREVYFREGLLKPEHKIEEPLKPDSEYYWSIRIRRGQRVSAWSLYDYDLFLGTAYISASNYPFIFKTPEEE